MARIDRGSVSASLLFVMCAAALAVAQAPAPGPQVVSPEVMADRQIVFRILAPQAQAVRLSASDIPGVPFGPGAALSKGENGVWEMKVGPVPPGAYRYTFNVDGVATMDPRNPSTSESNNNSWSMVYVPGLGGRGHDSRCRTAASRKCTTTRRRSRRFAACTSTRRPATRRTRRSIRCSTCCTAPATATTRGAPSAAPASSSTT